MNSITLQLPSVLQSYVEAANRHDVQAIFVCFADDAAVEDEGSHLRGKNSIEAWVVTTIGKYKFQYRPLGVREDGPRVVVAIEVSGTFDGSPVTLDFNFVLAQDRIASLAIRLPEAAI